MKKTLSLDTFKSVLQIALQLGTLKQAELVITQWYALQLYELNCCTVQWGLITSATISGGKLRALG